MALAALFVLAVLHGSAGQWGPVPTIKIDRDDIVITSDAKVAPGVYGVADPNKNGVIQIGADNVTLDLHGAVLLSSKPLKADQEAFEGIGIAINGHKDVTIKGGAVRGFRWNIRAEGCQGLKIVGCDVSRSWGQRIMRGEMPVNIFLDLRNVQAWRTYGAGIWLEKCSEARIEKCKGTGAQNGALLVDCLRSTVHDSDFSFNSGWGIGFYRSSDCVASWSKCDFVNRPWGGGWGGDSAGLVVVNGSHRNLIVGNSFTHSGDGFFLSDHRNGGDFDPKTLGFDGSCNDNVIAYNDGSWSTANAFEGTFSLRNVYYKNKANDSNYGFWLGYSSFNSIFGNEIQRNRFDGIALEQGQNTRVESNSFLDNKGIAVHLWSAPDPERMSRNPSMGHEVLKNKISKSRLAMSFENSKLLFIEDNDVTDAALPPSLKSDKPAGLLPGIDEFFASDAFKRCTPIFRSMPQGFSYYGGPGSPVGWKWIQFDEFAPRDFRNDLAAWRMADTGTLELFLLDANVRVTAPPWVEGARKGRTVTLTPKIAPSLSGEYRPFEVSIVSERRSQKIEGRFLTAVWDCRWYKWPKNDVTAYEDAAGWKRVFAAPPVHQENRRQLPEIEYGKEPAPGTGLSYFALVAKTKIKFDAGKYRFASLSDDGFRLYVDGKEVISRWNHHGATPDEATVDLNAGVHEIVVHYSQEFGGCVLRLSWEKL